MRTESRTESKVFPVYRLTKRRNFRDKFLDSPSGQPTEMSELAKKKKTQAGYRSYVTKINETHTILEKFEEEKEGVGGEKNRKGGNGEEGS